MAAGDELDRRTFVRGAAIAAAVAAAQTAQAAGEGPALLSQNQWAAIEALGDTLLPGSAAAGLKHFIASQLQKKPQEALLTLRYVDVSPPFTDFYESLVRELNAASQRLHAQDFAVLNPQQRAAMVQAMSGDKVQGWGEPPASLAYFVVRSDALDVVYGTMDGFTRLNIPYLAHILPTQPW
jgi:hypothetical protein